MRWGRALRRVVRRAFIPMLASVTLAAPYVLSGRAFGAAGEAEAPGVTIAPEARQVMDRIAAHYAAIERVRVVISTKYTLQRAPDGADAPPPMEGQRIELTAARPNRVAVRGDAPEVDATSVLVCDGTTLSYFIGGPFNKYERSPAPDSLGGVLKKLNFGADEPIMRLANPSALVLMMLTADGLGSLSTNARAIDHVGREPIDGRQAEGIRVATERFDVTIWALADGAPWIVRVVPDTSKAMAELGEMAEEIRANIPLVEHNFTEWSAPADLPPDAFAFVPPEGAQQVDSLLESLQEMAGAGMGDDGEEPGSELVGNPAPALDLELLTGGKASLAAHKGADVVILDFWATWCGPCVKGLPIVSKVAASLKDKGVAFYAVNERETPETIRGFLDKRKLALAVALDSDGKAGERYDVRGIPQTVLIGKDGTVQAVHVGLMPDLEERLTREVTALLEGKSLAAERVAARGAQRDADPLRDAPALEEAWRAEGAFDAVCVDASGREVVVLSNQAIHRFDPSGKQAGRAELPKSFRFGAKMLRAADLAGDKASEVIVFDRWGPAVEAFSAAGDLLWAYSHKSGVDDAWTADLDADGSRDEVIIGYNGMTGLHALNADGSLRWQYTGIGNVWHVCSGVLEPGAPPQVVTTSAAGLVHIFDAAGAKVRDISPGFYATVVRVAPHGPGDKPAIIATADMQGAAGAFAAGGQRLWESKVAPGMTIDAAASASEPWFAMLSATGRVAVIDTRTGEVVGQVKAGSRAGGIAWLDGAPGQPSLLLVASQTGLAAYRLPGN